MKKTASHIEKVDYSKVGIINTWLMKQSTPMAHFVGIVSILKPTLRCLTTGSRDALLSFESHVCTYPQTQADEASRRVVRWMILELHTVCAIYVSSFLHELFRSGGMELARNILELGDDPAYCSAGLRKLIRRLPKCAEPVQSEGLNIVHPNPSSWKDFENILIPVCPDWHSRKSNAFL